MPFASLIAIALITLSPGNPAGLTGTWTLNRMKSDFGAASAPTEFIVHVQQAGTNLDITVIAADANGQRVTFRQGQTPNATTTLLLSLDSDPAGVAEEWRLTSPDELTITRLFEVRSHLIRQRLVLVAVIDLGVIVRAEIDHLRLSIERYPDHWRTAVINHVNGACLYRAECTDVHAGQDILLDFASFELGRRINDKEVIWTVAEAHSAISQR